MTDEYKTISGTSEGAYSELRSKFLAFAHPVTTVEEAMAVVEQYQKLLMLEQKHKLQVMQLHYIHIH